MAATVQALRPGQPTPDEPAGRVSQGCEIQGRIEYDGTIRIAGSVEGEVLGRDGVVIEAGGKARARVRALRVRVEGVVEGDVEAHELLEIAAGGEVFGNVSAPAVSIEPGGVLEGSCRMGRRPASP